MQLLTSRVSAMRPPPSRVSGPPLLRALCLWLAGTLFVPAAWAQCLRTVPATDNATLASALAGALPGDCIALADGTYSGFLLRQSGTTANPITIHAANPSGATISSGLIQLAGVSNVVLQGLAITTPGGGLVVDGTPRTVAVVLTNCNNCRLTRCVFNLASPASGTEWVFFGGSSNSNRVDHCEFGPLSTKGRFLYPCGNAVIPGVTPNPTADRGPWAHGLGPYNPNMARYTQIDHNYFHDHAGGTSESIVLGGIGITGDYQGTMSTVEFNLFVNCDGDNAEIISTKSSTNTIRFNTVITSAGMFSLRAGNASRVYGNFFLCGGRGGGVKVNEMQHQVFNNYIEYSDSSSYPIMLENGDPYDSPSFGHAQVVDAQVVHNTVCNPGRPVLLGHTSTRPLKPLDCLFANNLLFGPGTLYSEDNPTNLLRSQNLVWPTNPGKTGFLLQDPLVVPLDGLQKLSPNSPAINAAAPNFSPFVTDDLDGQPRDAARDIGADEYSNAPILRHALTTNEVGPNALDTPPTISARLAGNTLILSGANGLPGRTCYVLATTNLALPPAAWPRLATNRFDPYGAFPPLTNSINPELPQSFYSLQMP